MAVLQLYTLISPLSTLWFLITTHMWAPLCETFVDVKGEITQIQTSDKTHLDQCWRLVEEIVIEGEQCDYISTSDSELMVNEEPRPGRLYGLVKDDKPVSMETGIPPLWEHRVKHWIYIRICISQPEVRSEETT